MTTPTTAPTLVWCAGVSWDDIRGTDRHLATHLSDHLPILWVDPPLSIAHAVRTGTIGDLTRSPRLRVVAPGITRLTVLAPPFAQRRGVRALTAAVFRRRIRRAVSGLGCAVAALVVTSPTSPLDALPSVTRVYFATDDFVSGAELMGRRADRVASLERKVVSEAEILLAVAPEILTRWGPQEKPTFVLPNGCDPEHYLDVERAAFPVDVDLPHPMAGLVGQISERVDLALLEAVADRGTSLLLVGPIDPLFEPTRVARLLARRNVRWVGAKPFELLPSYLRAIDVGLTPYADTLFNRASFPLKTLEYLAAGRAVVATPLPAVGRLGSDLIRTAREPTEFSAAVVAALEEVDSPELRDKRRAFARQHAWANRAVTFLELTGIAHRLE